MDDPAFDDRAAIHRPVRHRDGEFANGPAHGGWPERGHHAQDVSLEHVNPDVLRFAEPDRAPRHRIEHGPEVGGRARDDPQDLARRRLLLERLGQRALPLRALALGVGGAARAALELPLQAPDLPLEPRDPGQGLGLGARRLGTRTALAHAFAFHSSRRLDLAEQAVELDGLGVVVVAAGVERACSRSPAIACAVSAMTGMAARGGVGLELPRRLPAVDDRAGSCP